MPRPVRRGFTLGMLVVGLALGLAATAYWRKPLAAFLWQRCRMPGMALFVNPEVECAMRIGNDYFNVSGDGTYDLGRARRYFLRALQLDSNTPEAWHQLARIDFLQRNFSSALEKINTQIALHGERFMASYYIRGLICGYIGTPECLGQAEEDFTRFLAWDPNNWAARNDLAWISFQQGEYERAEAVASQGLQDSPGNPWLLNMRGIVLLNLGLKQEAGALFEQARSAIESMTEADWHTAYPGNHPGVAAQGIEEMKRTVEFNMALVTGTPARVGREG